jgi:hypothetical protein
VGSGSTKVGAMEQTPRARRRGPWIVGVVGALVLLLVLSLQSSTSRRGTPPEPESGPVLDSYAGTNYYAPVSRDCPYYTSWTPACYDETREVIAADMQFLTENGGGNLHRLWISLDGLFSCFDEDTGFCGYDDQALANVVDALRLMARHRQTADLVLFAQSNRESDVDFFRVEALDGEHDEMRANYIEAAEQFVRTIAADPVAASAVAVIDMENEGYFQNRRALLDLDTACGNSGRCIDESLSEPFFAELYDTLKAAAPQFSYTLSAVRGELLGPALEYWVTMYPVDVYDVHLYLTDPAGQTDEFARVRELPKPWFAGEVGTSNTDDDEAPCYTYDGNDSCTVDVLTWWREHLGPEYGASAVLVENKGTIIRNGDSGPDFTRTGEALARIAWG